MTENKFFMGFWNYTRIGVLDSKDAAKDWKELGINLAMSSVYLRSDDKNLMLSQLDEAHKNGIQVIVYDERTMWKNLENGEEAFRKDVEDAIEDFGAHPAFYAFFVGDEPPRRELERAIRAIQIVNERSKAYLNFLPMGDEPFVSDYGLKNKYEYEDVLVDAMKRSGLSTVCYDNYAQCYIHNREYGLNSYFDNLRVYRNVAHRVGCDFWTSLLSVPHWSYRNLTEDDIRWQISTAVAHGAKGLQWFYL